MYECGAKVSDPHVPGARKKNVFWLEIAVHDAHVVKSIEAECLKRFVPKNDLVEKHRWSTRNPQFELSIAVIAHQTRPSRWLPIDRIPSNPRIVVTNYILSSTLGLTIAK